MKGASWFRAVKASTMNIDTPHGYKVVYLHPTNGMPHDQNLAKKKLRVGEVYTVDWINVQRNSSVVHLVEVPGFAFNTVLFQNEECV